MKGKLCYLWGMIGACWMVPHLGFSAPLTQETIVVADTAKQTRMVEIIVKDWSSSKPLDSVWVTMGKESKFTENGRVKFENNPGTSIVLSKPGYNRIGQTISSTSLTVKMLKTEELLGSFSTDFSGAVTKVSGDAIRNVSVRSLVDGLGVYVPSLLIHAERKHGNDPNHLAQVRLRGISNFPFSADGLNKNISMGLQVNPSEGDYRAAHVMSTGSPTFLLDGVQVSLQVVQDLDINRVESVSILKDALATSSYGMRGGNGVIAIKTIRPQGRFQVSFSEQLQVVTADLSSFKRLSAKEKLEIEKASGLFDGDLSAVYQSRYNQAHTNNINTDWLAVPLRNGVGSKHTLGLSAGNDDIVYGLNASYNDIAGTMKGSHRKILDLGAFFGGRIGSLTFNNQFSYLGMNAANSPYGAFNDYLQMNPYWEAIDPYTGKFQKMVEEYTLNDKDVFFKNPAFNALLSTTDENKYARFSNLTNLNWIFGHGFQLNGMVSLTKQSDEKNYFLPPNHTLFADISPDNLFKRGMYQYTSNSFWDVQGGVRLQYQNRIGKHQLSANLGQLITQTSSASEAVEVSGFAVDRLAEISFGAGYSVPKPISGKIVTRYASSFANLGYSYDKRYQLDVSASLDYYSGLNNSSTFGAAGATWNIHQESFMKPIDWINALRVRGSVGTSSNQDFLSYLNRTVYRYYTDRQYVPAGSGISTIGRGLGTYVIAQGNKYLKTPKTLKQDIAVDATLFNNRLSVYMNAFRQENQDMLLPLSSLSSTGYQDFAHYTNYGKIETKGVEFGLVARALELKNNLKLNIIANGYSGTDKIVEIGPYLSQLNTYHNTEALQDVPQPQYVVGYSPLALWAVPSKGINAQTGEELFQKKDGSTTTVWSAEDKVFAGNLSPKWIGTFGVDMTFRQFSFATFFTMEHGAMAYNETMAAIENTDVNTHFDGRVKDAKRWTPGMVDAMYKGLFQSPTYMTSRLVEKDNRLQCSTISLGYELPKNLVEKWKAQRLGIKVMVNNAFEVFGADMQRGTFYPFQRQYSLLINATF
ncbi:TonB-dependent receptor plug domain-containing protein [Sphingobacterium lumbrici]|uniref:TonB-dependent receptor plug domain-containing protein n=1 Tax=Sphingobacterium lumbrici TaxID=2559600 RepID=UPI0015E29B17|nr:TonB-dependent receptor [Sphingobacterium lumbrici]